MSLCCFNKKKIINSIAKDDLIELNVCTLNTRFFQSVNYLEKINLLINFIINSDIEIICLQEINDVRLTRTIVKKIFKYNLTSKTKKLVTYPMTELFYLTDKDSNEFLMNDTDSAEIMRLTWSNSDDNNITEIDSLIITKENIISSSKVMLKSFTLNTKPTYVYIANIEWNNTIVSIYNTTFQNDYVGISHEDQRKTQINELNEIIIKNNENINKMNDYMEYNKKNINIVCCQSNIKELLNNTINKEYLYLTRKLNSLDTYRYVQTLKGIVINNEKDSTDVSGMRNNYVLLAGLNTEKFENFKLIGKELYDSHNLIIVNAKIKKIKLFEDYAVIVTFLSKRLLKLIKPMEDLTENIAIEIT